MQSPAEVTVQKSETCLAHRAAAKGPLCPPCHLEVLTEPSSSQRAGRSRSQGKSQCQEHRAAFPVPPTCSLSTCLGDGRGKEVKSKVVRG